MSIKPVFLGILFLLLASSNFSVAQQKKNVRDIIMTGNEYYFNNQFSKASEFYFKALKIDSANLYANYYMAECQRKLFDFLEAEHYYKIVTSLGKDEFPLAQYYFPLMQKLNGNFKEAAANFDKFIAHANEKSFEEIEDFKLKAIIEKKGCFFAMDHLKNPFGEYDFHNLAEPVNSRFNDYGPFILVNDSTLGFTSGRNTATGRIMDNRYGEYFSDNFRFSKDSTEWNPMRDDDNFKVTNTELGEGAGSYSHLSREFYFTGCYEDDGFCKIFVSKKSDGKWQTPIALEAPINLKGTDNKQPSITRGGDTLFFVSSRPGGAGGNDIWFSIKQEGIWANPTNLGDRINTPYNEVSPFYYEADDILFFSSDGHEGLGGLDVFMVKGGIETIERVENLGFPFNSNYDDSYLVLGKKRGYLSSNRQGGFGNFDLYQFNIITFQSIIADVTNTIEKTERILRSRVMRRNGAEVYVIREEDQFFYDNLQSEEKAIISRIIAAKLKAFSTATEFTLSPEDKFFYERFSVLGRNRIDRMARVLYTEGKEDLQDYLTQLPEREALFNYLAISGTLYEKRSDMPASGIDVPLIDEEGNIVKVTTTNEDGTFKYINLPRNRNYRILADNTPKKLTEYSKFYVKDVNIEEKTKKALIIAFENIYFDVDKSELRPEAKKVLDELVGYYQKNPQVQIEIYAYTDLTGTDEYNLSLSADRGKAAYNYLVAKEVDRTALVIEALGKDTTIKFSNDTINKQLNRRVAFNIVGAKELFHSETKTFILQKEMSIKELSDITGNTIADIQELNGITTEIFPAYSPVRLKDRGNIKDEEYFYLP